MIAIITTDAQITTERVINWLRYFEHEPMIITYKKIQEIQSAHITEMNEFVKNSQQLNVLWNWRYTIPTNRIELNNSTFEPFVNKMLKEETTTYINYILSHTKHAYHISSFKQVNKLIVLEAASKAGLLIPDSFIVNSKEDLYSIFQLHEKVITKPLSDSEFLIDDTGTYCSYTSILGKNDFIPESFPHSFIQQYIEKEYEIRTFYLESKCYSMAILTCNDTYPVDYRENNHATFMRRVPFTLPDEIEQKITNLMDELELKTGSIDLIYGKDKNFYFLEVNPIGQFSMLSNYCNYHIERDFAKKLIEYDRNTN